MRTIRLSSRKGVYWRINLELGGVFLLILAIGIAASRRAELRFSPSLKVLDVVERKSQARSVAKAAAVPSNLEIPSNVDTTPERDHEAIARATERLRQARRERLIVEEGLEAANKQLRQLELESAKSAIAAKTLPERYRDPRARLASIQTRGVVVQQETTQIKAELNSLAQSPRPRRKVLSDRTPVARTVEGKEYHFEVRNDRVAFIDLERLVQKLEADAKLQIRLSRGSEPRISSQVGPVGAFSLSYVLSSAMPGSVDSMLGLSVGYELSGWEIIPQRSNRGETLAAIPHPASEFSQVLNSLNPGRATITLWIYPEGFKTYGVLKSALHERGFQIAARPLPTRVPIRGSPNGSLSAGQ